MHFLLLIGVAQVSSGLHTIFNDIGFVQDFGFDILCIRWEILVGKGVTSLVAFVFFPECFSLSIYSPDDGREVRAHTSCHPLNLFVW